MTTRSVWRPAMYGGFAGVAVGALSMIAHWISPNPGLCALQFAAILGCGIGGGLVVAYGPVHALAWVLGMNRRDATWKDLAKRVAFLFIVAMLITALLAAAWKPDFRLKFLMFAWVTVLLILMAAGPKMCDKPRRRWLVTCCDALAAVYGPFVVAGVNTWLFDGFNTWMKVDFWKYLVLVPGGVIMELISVAIWHRHPGLPPAIMFALSALLSAMVVIVTTWLTANARWTRWLVLPLICGLCAFGALALDAMMRA